MKAVNKQVITQRTNERSMNVRTNRRKSNVMNLFVRQAMRSNKDNLQCTNLSDKIDQEIPEQNRFSQQKQCTDFDCRKHPSSRPELKKLHLK